MSNDNIRYEPHPYALLLPPLTSEEYAALKADIAKHGVLYPVILDEDGRVLDGVHRERIAAELGIELPVAVHAGLDGERKLHLTVGLNTRRRHFDPGRRRELARTLHDQGQSVRKIAELTGWSKSTIDRDLKTPPEPGSARWAELVRRGRAADWGRADVLQVLHEIDPADWDQFEADTGVEVGAFGAAEVGAFRAGMWRCAAIVACWVTRDGDASGGKVPAAEFAADAGRPVRRVLDYLAAWDRAAEAGLVPPAAELTPESSPELPSADLWDDDWPLSDEAE
jgi:hypothetical protein